MGVGGVTAMGCTIGQGLSGVSTLALGSFIALAGIIAGAVLALRYQVWRIERSVSADLTADLERRFGGLRRLYGDAGYAPHARSARGRRRSGRRRLVGRRRRWRAAAWPS